MRILIILLIFFVSAASASGQSTNLLKNPNGDEGLQSWKVFGNASVSDCSGMGKCFSISQDSFIFQDVNVSESIAGTFVVLIGFASIEETNLNDAHLLGRPYLFGYFMNSGELRKATVLSYLKGQEMANHPSASGVWVKQDGIFQVSERTGRIRLFLRSGCPNTSSSVNCVSRFRQPGVFLFGNEDEARAFVNTYQ